MFDKDSQLSKIQKQLDAVRVRADDLSEELDNELIAVNKQFGPLWDKAAELEKKFEKLGDVAVAVQALQKTATNLSATIQGVRRELDAEVRAVKKEITPLYDKDAEFEKNFREQASELADSVHSVRKEFDTEVSAVKKELGPLYDKDAEFEKKFKNIERLNGEITKILDSTGKTLAKVDEKVSVMEQTWGTQTLKKILERLAAFAKALASLEGKSATVMRTLERANAGITSISKHASDIEAEHMDAKLTAQELAKKSENLQETVDQFFKQIDAVNNKLSANASILAGITSNISALKSRMDAAEAQAVNIPQLRNVLSEQAKCLDQLAQKLAYLEKVTVKTIVLE